MPEEKLDLHEQRELENLASWIFKSQIKHLKQKKKVKND